MRKFQIGTIFRCSKENCNAEFQYKNSLKRHTETVHEEIHFSCEICGKKFTRNSARLLHERKQHQTLHNEAPTLEKGSAEQQDIKPQLPKPQKDYVHCVICKNIFSSHANRERHYKLYHQAVSSFANSTCYPCAICKKVFLKQSNREKHYQKLHNGARSLKEEKGIESSEGKQPTTVERNYRYSNKLFFPCGICKDFFTTKAKCAKHYMKYHKAKYFSCAICRKAFTTKGSRDRHSKNYHKESGFSKEIESQTVLSPSTMKKPFRCEICAIDFASYSLRERHYRVIHNGAKSLIEEQTQSVFIESPVSAQKPIESMYKYACEICGLRFTFNYNRTRHYKTIHNINIKSASKNSSKKGSTETFIPITGDSSLRREDINIPLRPIIDVKDIKEEPKDETLEKPSNCEDLIVKSTTNFTKKPVLTYSCDICGKCFILKHNRAKHYENKHNINKSRLSSTSSHIENSKEQPILSHIEDHPINATPSEVVINKKDIKRHVKTSDTYPCEICGTNFTFNYNRTKHYKNKHNMDKSSSRKAKNTINKTISSNAKLGVTKEDHSKRELFLPIDIIKEEYIITEIDPTQTSVYAKIKYEDISSNDSTSPTFPNI